jgi:hypothetical protein
VRLTLRKAHPAGRGRSVRRAYGSRFTVGASASGGATLPEGTDTVTITAYADDGADLSASSLVIVAFTTADDGNSIDALIGKLTDLRARMRRDRGAP